MSTLSLQTIDLKPSQLRALQKKARREGKTAPEYIRWLIERELLAEQPFDEILKPIRDDVRQSRMDENLFDKLVDQARRVARRKTRERAR